MRSIPLAITWELLTRGRWLLPGAFLAGMAYPAMIFTALRFDGPLDPEDMAPLVIMHLIMVQINVFIFGAALLTAQRSPSRLYAYPVTNAALVACDLLPAMAAVFLETICATLAINAVFDLEWPLWGPALFGAVSLAAIKAVLWLTEKTHWIFAGLTVVSVPMALWYKSRYGSAFSPPSRMWTDVTPGEFAVMLSIGLIAYWGALQGIARLRRGDTIPPLGIVAWITRMLDPAPALGLAFPAP